MKNVLFLLTVTLLLVSCASPLGIPKVSDFKVSPGSKIGILVIEEGEHPIHTHIGTTIFNNFVKTYENQSWTLKSQIEENLNKQLSNDNLYTVINLEDEGISFSDVNDLVVYKSGEWMIDDSKLSTYDKLTKELGVDAIVVAKEQEVLAYLECTGGPCTAFTTEASGLFTRSFLGIKSYWAVTAFDTNIYILNAPTNAAGCKSFRNQEELRSAFIRKGFKPKDLKSITPEEWTQVKVGVDKYIKDMTAMIPGILTNGCPSA